MFIKKYAYWNSFVKNIEKKNNLQHGKCNKMS
jgi:hypothetical protein